MDREDESVLLRVPRQVSFLQRLEPKPQVTEFMVKSTIISHYAFTAVSCTMINRMSEAKEAVFQMQIPAAAFISNFTMIVGGRAHYGEVKGKEEKQRSAKRNGSKTPGSANRGNEVENFQIAVSIPGKNRAIFLLTYEELLQRRLGMYEHTISVRPQQLVGKLLVEVNIQENSGITHLEIPPLRKGKRSGSGRLIDNMSPPMSTTVKQTKNSAQIIFNPNIVHQAKIAQNGILGNFVVRYDVNRELGAGDIQILHGYFVHYFAPKDLPPVPKNVVFVIDTSASMLGTKIKQTKNALFTILRDLRPEDHFNIVSFSNRIKVWQKERLVAVTPNNIRDAKKYIHLMSPSGGTNINEAIQTGAKLLRDYLTDSERSQNGVSLIIFLTDGQPTVGETQPFKIVSNTKNAIQEQFCLFSIGIGNDVDYRLLNRMALENCGTMRRILEDTDASVLLKGFYDEIGTPLLSDVHIDYAEGSVEYVTQNMFTNYFNGSEIVIAGKLSNSTPSMLHVQVTANTNNKNLMLEKDVAVGDTAANGMGNTSKNGDRIDSIHEEDYVERLWGYLTIKELLKTRLKSDNSKERKNLTEQAQNLSLTYNFLTPVTSMEVKRPEIQLSEPRDSSISASEEAYRENSQSLQRPPKQTESAIKKQEKKTIIVTKTSADGDPHFVVDFPLSKIAVCFNIDGEPGDILRLVSDHKNSGVTVNGQLIGAPAPPNGHKKQRTYFSSITVVVNRPHRAYIQITPHKIVLDSVDRLVLPCDKTASVESHGLAISVTARSSITLTIQGSISFVILVHQYKNPAPYQKDHLGFYISNSKGLSSNSHGLLGSFQNQTAQLTTSPAQSITTMLKVKDRLVPVVRKQRKIYNGRQKVDCWFAKNNAAKLIDGMYQDYLVSHLFDTGTGSEMMNEL
uniref:Inter-alpha-trypsin inhibitor heavy chain 5 n=1 Tax=Latimeria chalumnae TaxID=7897 RepID=H3ARB8_LATCH